MFYNSEEIEFIIKCLELTTQSVVSLDKKDYSEAYATLGELHMDLSLLMEHIKKRKKKGVRKGN